MLSLVDLVDLVERPPLMPGEARLPWADPSFSARMLAEHLDDTLVRAGLAVDARFGDLSGAEGAGDDEFETLVLRAE